jgi:hypothetical protein
MKTFYALLIAALFTTAACGKKKDEAAKTDPAKTEPAAKGTDPAKTEPAKTEPAMTEPAKTEPAKTEPAKTEPAMAAVTVESAGAKAMEFADKIAKVSTDAGDDCAKLGAGLKGLIEDAKVVVAQEKEIEKDAAKKKEFETKFEKKAEEKIKAPMKKVEKCMTNADVKAFIETLGA